MPGPRLGSSAPRLLGSGSAPGGLPGDLGHSGTRHRPRNPGTGRFPNVNTNKEWFQPRLRGAKWVFLYPQYDLASLWLAFGLWGLLVAWLSFGCPFYLGALFVGWLQRSHQLGGFPLVAVKPASCFCVFLEATRFLSLEQPWFKLWVQLLVQPFSVSYGPPIFEIGGISGETGKTPGSTKVSVTLRHHTS